MMVSKDQLIKELMDYPGKKVKLAVVDMEGILRGKIVHIDKFLGIVEGGGSFCDVVFGWDINDLCYENGQTFTGWHTGYPDALCEIDLNTFRTIPWDGDIPFFLADFRNKEGKSLDICPRSLLKRVRDYAKNLGYQGIFAQEFEWFNFLDESDDLHDRGFHRPNPITRGMFGYSVLRASQNKEFFNDLFDLLLQFKVPLEGIHTETGPGVYEAAIAYDDILDAGDRAVLFKTATKEIAHRHGIIPTFMAKWSDDYPGCGGHVHQSLWRDGRNIFFDEKGDRKMSDTMKSYMAGILHCLPQILPMYAPNVNSFKRLVEGAWAPTTITWGVDNRTVALRALPGGEKSTRMEMRVCGSDVNPYLSMAACLRSGLYGIENKLKLEIPESKGNGYKDLSNGVLARDLQEATQIMKNSEVAKELFGEGFVDHFTKSREWEWKQSLKTVTNWELERYFEIV